MVLDSGSDLPEIFERFVTPAAGFEERIHLSFLLSFSNKETNNQKQSLGTPYSSHDLIQRRFTVLALAGRSQTSDERNSLIDQTVMIIATSETFSNVR